MVWWKLCSHVFIFLPQIFLFVIIVFQYELSRLRYEITADSFQTAPLYLINLVIESVYNRPNNLHDQTYFSKLLPTLSRWTDYKSVLTRTIMVLEVVSTCVQPGTASTSFNPRSTVFHSIPHVRTWSAFSRMVNIRMCPISSLISSCIFHNSMRHVRHFYAHFRPTKFYQIIDACQYSHLSISSPALSSIWQFFSAE